jgi:hypothetical protein
MVEVSTPAPAPLPVTTGFAVAKPDAAAMRAGDVTRPFAWLNLCRGLAKDFENPTRT